MSRKATKDKKRTKCSYSKCIHKDSFKKKDGILYKGKYYCGNSHKRKAKDEK